VHHLRCLHAHLYLQQSLFRQRSLAGLLQLLGGEPAARLPREQPWSGVQTLASTCIGMRRRLHSCILSPPRIIASTLLMT
jgi:hypothetical protein